MGGTHVDPISRGFHPGNSEGPKPRALYLVWNWVISKLGAVTATNWVYFNPITTILFAWWLLHEQITIWFLLGTVLILVGMYLADKCKK